MKMKTMSGVPIVEKEDDGWGIIDASSVGVYNPYTDAIVNKRSLSLSPDVSIDIQKNYIKGNLNIKINKSDLSKIKISVIDDNNETIGVIKGDDLYKIQLNRPSNIPKKFLKYFK